MAHSRGELGLPTWALVPMLGASLIGVFFLGRELLTRVGLRSA